LVCNGKGKKKLMLKR